MKITVVGSGFVGQTSAMRLLEERLGDVVLIDIIEDKPQGLALDLKEAAPIQGYEPVITGTNDYADTAGSDIVVITAGFPRQPGMSRMDLLARNATIMRDVVGKVAPGSPEAILIIVSNPLDEMTHLAADESGFPRQRVMGMAGVLDSARLRFFIAEELGVSPSSVEAMTLGSHGDAMVALPHRATVDGQPLSDLVDDRDARAALPTDPRRRRRGRVAPEDGVGLLRTERVRGGHGEGDRRRHEGILPVCAWTSGPYGIEGVYLGVPVRLGRAGVEEIVELELGEDELGKLREAAEGIRAKCADLASV